MRAHRLMHLMSLTALAALSAVLLGACVGSNQPSASDSSGSSPKAFTASNADRYPACMRDHGVTNFPDPQVSGSHLTIQLNPSITDSTAFNSAQVACAHLLPPGAGRLGGLSPAQQKARAEGLLPFAACVRKHGFPSFPDPNGQGQLTLEMIQQAGINLQQPAVLQAGDACASASRGQITKTDVARAIAESSAFGSRSSPGGR